MHCGTVARAKEIEPGFRFDYECFLRNTVTDMDRIVDLIFTHGRKGRRSSSGLPADGANVTFRKSPLPNVYRSGKPTGRWVECMTFDENAKRNMEEIPCESTPRIT
jgi:hypothetical protein